MREDTIRGWKLARAPAGFYHPFKTPHNARTRTRQPGITTRPSSIEIQNKAVFKTAQCNRGNYDTAFVNLNSPIQNCTMQPRELRHGLRQFKFTYSKLHNATARITRRLGRWSFVNVLSKREPPPHGHLLPASCRPASCHPASCRLLPPPAPPLLSFQVTCELYDMSE